jgi:molybdopterin synthase catalytic subunit
MDKAGRVEMISVEFRYFAILRELLGRSSERRDLPDGTTAGEAFALVTGEQPRLAGLQRSVMLMVNQEYVRPEHALADGDELALIPPVSGGDLTLADLFRVTEEEIDPRAVERMVAGPDVGAVVTFTGTVRDNARGRDVVALEYEAYPPAAEKMLARIGADIADRWPSARVAITHRTGRLASGEASVVIAVASPHREAALAAAAYAIEQIKIIVPIWKKEFYQDGAVWVGSEAEYQAEQAGERG